MAININNRTCEQINTHKDGRLDARTQAIEKEKEIHLFHIKVIMLTIM